MWYGNVFYIFHIDKDMADDTKQVHNESIDMTYLGKGHINISQTGNNISFIEWKNLPYSFLVGYIVDGDLHMFS